MCCMPDWCWDKFHPVFPMQALGTQKCCGIKGKITANPDYVCPRCCDLTRTIEGRPATQVEVDGTQLEVVDSFCYLGDMLNGGGGCECTIVNRCCTAWGKSRKLLPILTSKHSSLMAHGKVFNACVRSTMLHDSETWAPSAPDLQRLRRNDRAIVRWIYGVKVHDGVHSDELHARLGIQEVTEALYTRRLR